MMTTPKPTTVERTIDSTSCQTRLASLRVADTTFTLWPQHVLRSVGILFLAAVRFPENSPHVPRSIQKSGFLRFCLEVSPRNGASLIDAAPRGPYYLTAKSRRSANP